jgi:hypothetical protein
MIARAGGDKTAARDFLQRAVRLNRSLICCKQRLSKGFLNPNKQPKRKLKYEIQRINFLSPQFAV